MTEQKSTTTRKRTARAKTTPVENNTVVEEFILEQPKVEAQKKRVLSDSDKVILLNNVFGRYAYNPKYGMPFRMVEYGDEVEITYEQLKNMFRNDRNHIVKGYIYITNEDIIKELNLVSVYEHMYTNDEVEDLLDDEVLLREVLNKMPEVMKETFLSFAYRKAKEGSLKNYATVRVIKELTGVDITINTTLQDWN